jgi:hypothetical protein
MIGEPVAVFSDLGYSVESEDVSAQTTVSAKMFNMHSVSKMIDQCIAEMGQYVNREPEIKSAVQVLIAAKRLLKAYSDRLLDTPYRSINGGVKELAQATPREMLVQLNAFIEELKVTNQNIVDFAMDSPITDDDYIRVKEGTLDIENGIEAFSDVVANLKNYPQNKSYTRRMKRSKGQYDNYDRHHQFDSAGTIFGREVDKRREAETERAVEDYERSRSGGRGSGADDQPRDSEGRFT